MGLEGVEKGWLVRGTVSGAKGTGWLATKYCKAVKKNRETLGG